MAQNIPPEFECPIGMEIMKDPVLAADGRSYERAAILEWFQYSSLSPMTGEALSHENVIPNLNLRALIQDWREKQGEDERKPVPAMRRTDAAPRPVPVHIVSWMWNDFGWRQDLAQVNPMRWSKGKQIDEAIADLRAQPLDRPVCLCCVSEIVVDSQRHTTRPLHEKFASLEQAITFLTNEKERHRRQRGRTDAAPAPVPAPIIAWMWSDSVWRRYFAKVNPMRWSKGKQIDETIKDLRAQPQDRPVCLHCVSELVMDKERHTATPLLKEFASLEQAVTFLTNEKERLRRQ